MNNVDAWGAAEWFGRMADAVRGHDAARVSGDEFADIEAETFKNIMTSCAFTLVHDYEQQVRSALVSAPTAEIDRLKAENERLRESRKKAFELAAQRLRAVETSQAANERLRSEHRAEINEMSILFREANVDRVAEQLGGCVFTMREKLDAAEARIAELEASEKRMREALDARAFMTVEARNGRGKVVIDFDKLTDAHRFVDALDSVKKEMGND